MSVSRTSPWDGWVLRTPEEPASEKHVSFVAGTNRWCKARARGDGTVVPTGGDGTIVPAGGDRSTESLKSIICIYYLLLSIKVVQNFFLFGRLLAA
ncbi:MAG: hypothetical protein AAF378_12220 [Cyanobacteria bacterium P01_A01_bin.84]